MNLLTGLQRSGLILPKKKKVLLVDTSRIKRDLRSETMRRLGAEVDCAADITEARCWWRPNLYDLVLIHGETGKSQTDRFCDDMRNAMPSQQVMFLVGKPAYLATSREEAAALPTAPVTDEDIYPAVRKALERASGNAGQSWGIFEACRRISAVRWAANARSQAMRDRPAPARDSEVSRSGMERAEAPDPSLQGVEDARAFLMASNLNDAEKGE
jgi:CheY-like chemotaxis protein